jgi:hypothetical protein
MTASRASRSLSRRAAAGEVTGRPDPNPNPNPNPQVRLRGSKAQG